SDRPPNGFLLVTSKIIQDHQVARRECWHQHLLDIGFETFAIDRTVGHKGRLDAIMPKGRHKGQGFPVAVRNFGYEPCPARRLSGAMLVFVHVSSMKTKRSGSICFCRLAHLARRRAMSGRSRSLA